MKISDIYLATAVCACHINQEQTGFRQKDVHFYFDLLTNWMEASLGQRDLQNIQVQRFLDQLVKKQILTKSGRLTYECKDTGLLPLIEMITTIEQDHPLDLFFFQYHILQLYQEQLLESILEKKINLPHSLKIELKYLLDSAVFVRKQITRIRKEIDKLELRCHETKEMSKLATKMLRDGKEESVVIGAVETAFPYQLHHQKKMSELFSKLAPNLRKNELTLHAEKRVSHLWDPMLSYYKDYLKRLESLPKT